MALRKIKYENLEAAQGSGCWPPYYKSLLQGQFIADYSGGIYSTCPKAVDTIIHKAQRLGDLVPMHKTVEQPSKRKAF